MAVAQGAKLVALPEYFAIMGMNDTRQGQSARGGRQGPDPGNFCPRPRSKHKIWLVGGSVPLASDDPQQGAQQQPGLRRQGQAASRATTRSTCSASTWARSTTPRSAPSSPAATSKVIDSPFGRIGLSICYDLRFPELYRAMKDVDIILVPSAFTETTGKAHWETLIRARAIENLAYVLAPAQGGYHRERPRNPRRQHDRRSVGRGARPPAARLRRGGGRRSIREYVQRLRKSLPALTHRTDTPVLAEVSFEFQV